MLIGECLGLLVQEHGDGAFGDASGNDGSELLDVREIHLGIDANLPGGSLASIFPPSDGQLTNLTEKLR